MIGTAVDRSNQGQRFRSLAVTDLNMAKMPKPVRKAINEINGCKIRPEGHFYHHDHGGYDHTRAQ